MQENLYNCEDAYDELPLYGKLFVQKYIKKTPIKVPVRRNCMTGSGIDGECHLNVMELVTAGRGNFLTGLLIQTGIPVDGENWLAFVCHTVWITPEGKAVDVTAHNYSYHRKFEIFIPLCDTEPLMLTKDFILNEDITQDILVILDSGVSYIPYSKFNLKKVKLGRLHLELAKVYPDWKGGFTLPSTATGKYWSEIVSERKVIQDAIA
jgi:hypothetical protein